VPFLRVLRDKRGYETSYLMDWVRDGSGRLRSRLLYAFRTPPGVLVGRTALDPSTRRELEQRFPALEFDWRTLLETQQVVDANPETRRPRGRRRGDDGPPPPRPARDAAPAVSVAPAVQPPQSVRARAEEPGVTDGEEVPAPSAPPRLQIPPVMEAGPPEAQVAWLKEWHGRIREEVERRTQDPERRDALLSLADRLNPDSWADEAAVAEGLVLAAEALERLSRVFGRRRRRSRRPRPAGSSEPAAAE